MMNTHYLWYLTDR